VLTPGERTRAIRLADDGFTVRIDNDLAEDVKAAAAAKGIPVEAFVRDALASHIFAEIEWSDDPDPTDAAEEAAKAILASFDRLADFP
jgi:hypothetical protein